MAFYQKQFRSQSVTLSLEQLEEKLRETLQCDFQTSVVHSSPHMEVRLLVFEQYFYRASGTISLSVLLTQTNETQTIDLISSGGGEGLSYTFGACRSFVEEFAAHLESYGFHDPDPEPNKSIVSKLFHYFVD